MAFDKSPSAWLGAGYTTGTDTIILTTRNAAGAKCLIELDNGEAQADDGDIRAIVHALCEAIFVAWKAQAAEDLPARMTMTRRITAAPNSTALTVDYAIRLSITPTLPGYMHVTPEPS